MRRNSSRYLSDVGRGPVLPGICARANRYRLDHGHVTDPSGAVVVGATVTAENTATG